MPSFAWSVVGAATAVASALLFLVILGFVMKSPRDWHGGLWLLQEPIALGVALFVATPIGLVSGLLLRWWISQREVG